MSKLQACIIITAVMALTFAFSPAYPETSVKTLTPPILSPDETYVYRVKEKIHGKSFLTPSKLIHSEHSFSIEENGNDEKRIIHTCREIRSDGAKQVWVFKYRRNSQAVRHLGYTLDKYTPMGKKYYHEESWFGDSFYQLPPDTIHLVSVPFALTGFNFAKGKKTSLHIYTQEGTPTAVKVKVEKEERLKVPWKELETWKVKVAVDKENMVKPRGMLGQLLTRVLPEFTVWYQKSAPHRPVRIIAEFGALTPGRPEFTQELVRIIRD